MASLTLIPYKYVPTKPRRRDHQPRKSLETQSSAHPIEQQIELGISSQKIIQASTSGVPGVAHGARETGRHENVQEMNIEELVTEGAEDSTASPSAVVPSGGSVIDQDTLGEEIGHDQFEVTGKPNLLARPRSTPEAN
jgi:hypothetical protein